MNILLSDTARRGVRAGCGARCARGAIIAATVPAIALLTAGCGGSGGPAAAGAPASTPRSP